MFFTQDDYKKIQQWLIKNSVKDTEFSEANIPFNGEETITIVQGNQNKKVFLKDLITQVFNLGISDFVNITDKYDAPNISLEEAIRLIPSRARKEGQVITFLDRKDHWHIYQFKGVLNQWNVLDTWEDLFDWEKLIIDSILPDEEDLTKSLPDANGNSYLSLKDREYNPEDFSGLGRVILRKNIVEIEDPIYGKVKKNVLYQDMFTQSNTIYEIRYDFDLNGGDITIPEGCVLHFQGGSISNGGVIGKSTKIKAELNILFINVAIDGTWIVSEIFSDWFYIKEGKNYDNFQALKNIFSLQSEEIYNTIYISKKDVYYTPRFFGDASDYKNLAQFSVTSNTKLILNANIYENPNECTSLYTIALIDVQNVSIEGSGSLNGDVVEHIGNDGEQKYGLALFCAKNVYINGISCNYFWGDGICVESKPNNPNQQTTINYSEYVIIDNVKCLYNRRNGLYLGGTNKIEILNSEFSYNGTIRGISPMVGIDIEPWRTNDSNKNIHIHDCTALGNVNQNITVYSADRDNENIVIERISGKKTDYPIFSNNVTLRDIECQSISFLKTNNALIENVQCEQIITEGITYNDNNIIRNSTFNANFNYSNDNANAIIRHYDGRSVLNITFENCNFKKGENASPNMRMSIFALNDNLKFIGCDIDFGNTQELYLDGVLYNSCTIKADYVSIVHIARNYNYVREFINNTFDLKNNERNIYIRYNNADDYFTGVVFRFIGNLSLNKDATNFIDFNYGAPYKDCTIEVVSNVINGDGGLAKIKNVANNAVIINNIFNTTNEPKNPINFTRWINTSLKPVQELFWYEGAWRTTNGYLADNTIGFTDDRPTKKDVGRMYYDRTLGMPIWYDVTKNWIDGVGNSILAKNVGGKEDRPNNIKTGFFYYDTSIRTILFNVEGNWHDAEGNNINVKREGTTSERPTTVRDRFQYFDTSLNKYIWKHGDVWVDATGAEV